VHDDLSNCRALVPSRGFTTMMFSGADVNMQNMQSSDSLTHVLEHAHVRNDTRKS
jgi:hypothetical protein